jgi:hypothetical protein
MGRPTLLGKILKDEMKKISILTVILMPLKFIRAILKKKKLKWK